MSAADSTFREVPVEKSAARRRSILRLVRLALVALVTLVVLTFFSLGPMGHGWGFHFMSTRTQQVRTIALAMFSYANDHDQVYPDGHSSTEVFQQLLDGQYVTDPRLFYIPMAGKVAALPGAKLKPENVCWDVTSGAGSNPPDDLPLVFMTGYKVTYVADASAVPLTRPYPPYRSDLWLTWFDSDHEHEPLPGIAVANANNNAFYKHLMLGPQGGEVYPQDSQPDVAYAAVFHFVPATFDAEGRTYRQLTPDGPLP